MPKILLTSFATWRSHQKSNSGDDLLELLLERISPVAAIDLELLRHLPVDIDLATKAVITTITKFSPRAIVCCGMAENSQNLAIEVQAFPPHTYSCDRESHPESPTDHPLTTTVDLEQITQGLVTTSLSDNAGKFVCEGLYYNVLSHLSQFSPPLPCIFVHVPLLTPENRLELTTEFGLILKNLANSDKIDRDHQKVLPI